MKKENTSKKEYITAVAGKSLLSLLAALLLCPFNLFSNSFAIGSADDDPQLPQSIPVGETPLPQGSEIVGEQIINNGDRIKFIPSDTVNVVNTAAIADSIAGITDEWVPRQTVCTKDSR